MEDALHQRVVGQDHVVTAISDAVRISRAGLQAPDRPVASFLFLGPTGVGKVTFFGETLLNTAEGFCRLNFAKRLLRSCLMTRRGDCKKPY